MNNKLKIREKKRPVSENKNNSVKGDSGQTPTNNDSSSQKPSFLDPEQTQELLKNPLGYALKMMAKKVRNVQKKCDKLNLIQDKKTKGGKLESDQVEALKSHAAVLTTLDTYSEIKSLFDNYNKLAEEQAAYSEGIRVKRETKLIEDAVEAAKVEFEREAEEQRELESEIREIEDEEKAKQALVACQQAAQAVKQQAEEIAVSVQAEHEEKIVELNDEKTTIQDKFDTTTNELADQLQINDEQKKRLDALEIAAANAAKLHAAKAAETEIDCDSINCYIRLMLILEPLRRLPIVVSQQILAAAELSSTEQAHLIKSSVMFCALPHESFEDAVNRIAANVYSFLKRYKHQLSDPYANQTPGQENAAVNYRVVFQECQI